MLRRTTLDTPIGTLRIVASDTGIREILLPLATRTLPTRALDGAGDPLLGAACAQLTEYFAGRRRVFDLALDPQGTDFQHRVWQVLRAIPYGTTVSYGEVAHALGRPGAARAVGAANGRNPIPIIVPCHRVIGADGTLVGYGGPSPEGLAMKRHLIDLEGAVAGRALA